MVAFSVPGNPIPFRHHHQSLERSQFKEKLEYVGVNKPLKGILVIDLHFVIQVPRQLRNRLSQEGSLMHTKKPELDNYTKFALKCMEGTIFRDSGQLVKICATKTYGEIPETRIVINRWSVDEAQEYFDNR